MLNPRSFADILTDLSAPDESAGRFHAGWESTQEPFGLAQLIGTLDLRPRSPARAAAAYPAKPRPTPPPRAPHTFSEPQEAAWSLLNRYTLLTDNFGPTELKSAYRRAVLATHPDRGGSGESFQAVRKSYQILAALVKTQA